MSGPGSLPPPSGEPADDETWAHPTPDEFGFGYYAIDDDETQRDNPSPRSPGDLTPITPIGPYDIRRSPAPTDDHDPTERYDPTESSPPADPTRPAPPRRTGAPRERYEPVSRPPRRAAPTGRPRDDSALDDTTFDDAADDRLVGRPAAPRRASRTTREPLNWRIPTIVTFAVLVVVIAVVVAFFPDDSSPSSSTASVPTLQMRELPSKVWQTAAGQHGTGLASDASSIFAAVRRAAGVQVVAFDLQSGEERWATTIDGAQDDGDGDLTVAGNRVLSLFSSPDDGTTTLRALDAKTGAVAWTAEVDDGVSTFASPTLLAGTVGASPMTIQPIDVAHGKVGSASLVDAVYEVGTALYIDQDGFLTHVDPLTLEPVGAFAFRHIETITAPLALDEGALLIGADDHVVRVSAAGKRDWTFDPRVGAIHSIHQLVDDRILVDGALGVRMIRAGAEEGANVSRIRSGSSLAAVGLIDDGDVVFVYEPPVAGTQQVTVTTLTIDGDQFRDGPTFQTLDARGVPRLQPSGGVVYAREQTRTGAVRSTQFAAYDVVTGKQLWVLPLADDQIVRTIATGLLVSSSSATQSLTIYAAVSGD